MKASWIAQPKLMCWNVASDHRASTDHGSCADGETRKDRGIGTDRSSLLNGCDGIFLRPLQGTREGIICKCDVRPDKYFIGNANAVPDLYPGFHRDPVAYHHIVLDENLGADVAIGTNPGTNQNNAKLPDASALTDVRRLDIGKRMD